MVSRSDLVYAAALFDSVGCVNIAQYNDRSSYVFLEYSGSFSHFHTTWLQARFGGNVSMPDPRVVSFRWRVRNEAAVVFVKQISLFVKLRAREVYLILEYGDLGFGAPSHGRQEIAVKLKALKEVIAQENSDAAVALVAQRRKNKK